MSAETAITAFNMANTGDSAKREQLSLWYNNRVCGSGTTSSPVWELVGYKLTSGDMAIEFETDEVKKDVVGNTFSTLAGVKRTFDLSDWEVIKGSSLQVDVENALRYENTAFLESQGDFCVVHHYMGTAGSAMSAERWLACGMKPSRTGGDGGGNLTTDISIILGGEKKIGTAAISSGTLTFTETEAPAWPGTLS